MATRKRKRTPEPLRAVTVDGDVIEYNTPEQNFLQELKGNEVKIVESIRKGLEGEHEPAIVTNATKVLEALDDPQTPDSMRPKLEALRELVMEKLLFVSQDGKVASSRAQANAALLRAMRGVGRADWPPDISDPTFADRFDRTIAICNERT